MSDGNGGDRHTPLAYWLGLAALGFIFLVLASGAAVQIADERQKNRAPYEASQPPAKKIAGTDSERIARALEDLAEAEKAPDKAEHERHDLDAQEGTWRWAKWTAWAAFWQLLLSGAGVWFVIQTLRQNQEAIKLARDAFAAENRPWLDIEISEILYFDDPENLILDLTMRLENKGRLPAYGVSFGVVLFDERGHYEARKAEAVINATKAVKSREMILPPSGEKEVISIPKMPWASFQKEQVTVRVAGGDENSGATLPLKIRAGIAVIVQYHWGSSNTDAHTAKTFSVSAVSASKSPGDRQLVFPLEPRVRPPKGLRVLDNGIASLT